MTATRVGPPPGPDVSPYAAPARATDLSGLPPHAGISRAAVAARADWLRRLVGPRT